MAMLMWVEGLQVKLFTPELTATTSKILMTILIIKIIILINGPKLVSEIANIPLSALFLLMFPRHKTDNFSS